MTIDMRIAQSSFRDDAGFVFEREGLILRLIKNSYKRHYDHFVSSGLYDALVREKMIVAHQEVPNIFADEDQYKIIRPEYIPFISYPYEWCFSQLKDAALLTLRIQEMALEYDMVLKDASAFNVQFHAGKPIFIDTTSFVMREAGKPWVAYRQFCEFFIAPLALMSKIDVRLNRLLQNHIDGISIELTSKILPWMSWFNMHYFLHIHLHARMSKRQAKVGNTYSVFNRHYLSFLTQHLRICIKHIRQPKVSSYWPAYYRDCNEGQGIYLRDKERIVANWLLKIKPKIVWDFGANTGHFSEIAARLGARVIAFDSDHDAVEALYGNSKMKEESGIIPVCLDLAQPSPAIGFANKERGSIWNREFPEVVLCLGLAHHLYFNNQIPFGKMAELMALTEADLIIEFVPADDRSLEEAFAEASWRLQEYSQVIFEKSFASYFNIKDREVVRGSGRVLYFMENKKYVYQK